ncbi:hypothetical protein HYPSUDRAFT_207926 [Hypholoma sublateritium FD-334 SS-4]|uniref:Uncharacterized protein n=1 Tax=Hypholoma sublateritium (strain FD-334 SS-4) TaxID=945553 RepID=A0A0D2NFC2_HYPSF|nr:hypothetical protein HYPSUDRAFT_207926 [Hypholoma sublateritium FD-334 SS-4]
MGGRPGPRRSLKRTCAHGALDSLLPPSAILVPRSPPLLSSALLRLADGNRYPATPLVSQAPLKHQVHRVRIPTTRR